MKFLGWVSLIFFFVAIAAVVVGLKNEDTWMLCLGTLVLCITNFFEIIINRDMIRNIKKGRKGK